MTTAGTDPLLASIGQDIRDIGERQARRDRLNDAFRCLDAEGLKAKALEACGRLYALGCRNVPACNPIGLLDYPDNVDANAYSLDQWRRHVRYLTEEVVALEAQTAGD